MVVASLFSFSLVFAQTSKDKLPGKTTEQNEIKADKHLEKEMQQKQLSAKPELLEPLDKERSEADKKAVDNCNKSGKLTRHRSARKS